MGSHAHQPGIKTPVKRLALCTPLLFVVVAAIRVYEKVVMSHDLLYHLEHSEPIPPLTGAGVVILFCLAALFGLLCLKWAIKLSWRMR